MASTGPKRYSRLKPMLLNERFTVAIHAFSFFSPGKYEEHCQMLGLEIPSRIAPFSVYQFLQYLEKKEILETPMRYQARIRDLLDSMEQAGLLTAMGLSSFVTAPKTYFAFKELTKRESQGFSWLSSALGPEFVRSFFGEFTVHIIGDNTDGEHAGTGIIISDRHILTCAHVLTGMTVREQQTFQKQPFTVIARHSHDMIDVGIMEVSPPNLRPSPSVSFRDPTIGEQLCVLGYPRVPLSKDPTLIMQGGEIIAEEVVSYFGVTNFLFSAIARPGNSGGPIISRSGHILGIVSQDLSDQAHPHALFYAGVAASTIDQALGELDLSVVLPIERYE